MAYSSFPRIVNPDFSPPQDIMSYQEPFDKNYFGEEYTANPDYSLSTFFDTESFFDQPLTSAETTTSQGFPSGPNPNPFNQTLPATGLASIATQLPPRQIALPTPLGQIPQYQPPYPLESPSLDSIEPTTFSPETYSTSRTPSLCGDFGAQPQTATAATTMTPMSPIPMKQESSSTPTSPVSQPTTTGSTPAQTRPQRKRGRPRLSRSNSASGSHSHSTSSSSKHAKTTPTSGRLPHNQVERKYREGLNSELERLRRAVPTLPQSSEAGDMGAAKPSKAMVLAGAIEYIHRVERERDALRREVEMLRREREGRGKSRAYDDGDEGMGWLDE